MRELVIKNNPERTRYSCEKYFKQDEGDKLVKYMLKNGMFNGDYDIYIKSWGRWILIEIPGDLEKICSRKCIKLLKQKLGEQNEKI